MQKKQRRAGRLPAHAAPPADVARRTFLGRAGAALGSIAVNMAAAAPGLAVAPGVIASTAATTYYFDPTAAAASSGAGTYADPFYTVAQVVAAFRGNMAGRTLAIRRGTTVRSNGAFNLEVHGSSFALARITAYGDHKDPPVISGANVVRYWVRDPRDAALHWTPAASPQEVYVDGARLPAFASRQALEAAERGRYYDPAARRIYVKLGEDPRRGQVEVTVGRVALDVRYADVPATGYVQIDSLKLVKGSDSILNIARPDVLSSIESISTLRVIGCAFDGAGVDGLPRGNDAIVAYGVSDELRALDCYFGSNVARNALNNALELGAMSAPVVEANAGYDCGGNSIVELWFSCANALIRHNSGYRSSVAGRLTTAYHQSGILTTIFTRAEASTMDHVQNWGHEIHGNLIVDAALQGIEVVGGADHRIYDNTIIGAGNRGINIGLNAGAAGAVSAHVSYNSVSMRTGGNAVAVDIMQGSTLNDRGRDISSLISGDYNTYRTDRSGTAPNLRVNRVATRDIAAYKTAAAPFDANAVVS